MKKNSIFLAALVAGWINVQGQSATSSNVVGTVPGKQIDVKANTRGIITQLPVKKGEPEGDVYLHSNWTTGDLTLASDSEVIKDLPMKLNLQNNELEINYNDEVKVLPGNRVKEFLLKQPDGRTALYVSGKSYKLNSTPLAGFLQKVEDGKVEENKSRAWQLFIKPQLTVIASNYNAALDNGSRSDKFVKGEVLLLGKGDVLYETKMPKNKFVKNFSGNEENINKFLKENKINLKDVEDLAVLVKYLNDNQI